MGPRLVEHLLYEPEESGILWIRFNRPERLNALVGTAEENSTVAKVGEYMRAGDDDPNIRVIVLTGVGRAFCAGANLASRAAQDVTGENFIGNRAPHEGPDGARQHFYHGFTALHRDIALIRKPTIAMINGPAVGSGMDMALHCDIRIGCGVNINVARTRLPGTLGEFSWGGAASTAFWVDPKEQLAVVFMTQVIGSDARLTLRRDLRTLVYSAMTESFA